MRAESVLNVANRFAKFVSKNGALAPKNAINRCSKLLGLSWVSWNKPDFNVKVVLWSLRLRRCGNILKYALKRKFSVLLKLTNKLNSCWKRKKNTFKFAKLSNFSVKNAARFWNKIKLIITPCRIVLNIWKGKKNNDKEIKKNSKG